MENKESPPGDDYLIRCPRLGHQVSFSYCRRENMGKPCFKILDCWFQHFPVEAYLKQELSPEEWAEIVNRPARPKVASLIELIEKARNRNG